MSGRLLHDCTRDRTEAVNASDGPLLNGKMMVEKMPKDELRRMTSGRCHVRLRRSTTKRYRNVRNLDRSRRD